jgi:hypothetical protein
VNDPPNDGGVGAPAAAVAAAGGSSEDLDVNKAPRINGLVVTPGGRVLVACPVSVCVCLGGGTSVPLYSRKGRGGGAEKGQGAVCWCERGLSRFCFRGQRSTCSLRQPVDQQLPVY